MSASELLALFGVAIASLTYLALDYPASLEIALNTLSSGQASARPIAAKKIHHFHNELPRVNRSYRIAYETNRIYAWLLIFATAARYVDPELSKVSPAPFVLGTFTFAVMMLVVAAFVAFIGFLNKKRHISQNFS